MHFQQVFLGSHRPFSGLRIFGCDAELKPQGECSQLCTRASRAASYTSSASVIWHVVSFGQNGTYRPDELLEHFTLLPDELVAIGNKSGATRLGFAVLLKCLQYEGRFLRSRQEAAPEVERFLAAQVGVDAALFAQYLWEGRTIEAYRTQIREMSKIREFR